MWTIKDNAFDQTLITQNGASVDHGYNAYITGCDRFTPTSTNDQVVASFGFAAGPLGAYYLPSGSPLINAGSQNATNVGLYHFTTWVDQSLEGFSTVDIGFHYVAVDEDGNPLDGDADGLADYFEDANGNGVYDSGDVCDFQSADTEGDGMPDGWEIQYGLNPLMNDADDDKDADGLTNLEELQRNADPTVTDTDNDYLLDGEEVHAHGTDPCDPDTDDDGRTDWQELYEGTDPRNPFSKATWPVLADRPYVLPAGLELQLAGLESLDPPQPEFDTGYEDGQWRIWLTAGDPDFHYDLIGKPDLFGPWTWLGKLKMDSESQVAKYLIDPAYATYFYAIGMPTDSDGDGLTDLHENYGTYTDPDNPDTDDDGLWDGWELQHGLNPLVHDSGSDADNDGLTNLQEYQGGTNPNYPECPREAYEVVVAGQSPDNWFKLDDSSLANAGTDPNRLPLVKPTTGGATDGYFTTDLFDKGYGAFAFRHEVNTDALETQRDVINGGDPTSKSGSVSLLFRSLTGQADAKRYLFCQKGSSSVELGVYFGPEEGLNSPAGLKVQIGTKTVTILPNSAIVFETWYYLAITWDEARDANEVKWYLGRAGGTLTSDQQPPIDLADTAVVGNSTTVYLGCRPNANNWSSFRQPGDGALDEVAFWNRELTADEIAAQFAVLPHGPSGDFDLSGWNLMLPVDDDGEFSGEPHVVDRVQLSSGFQYVGIGCTKNYFYRGTDGANGTMVFETPWDGAGASPRSELRGLKYDEIEEKWIEDNWIPGLGGTHILKGKCSVDVAGEGKIVIGQIHAETPLMPDGPDPGSDPDGPVPAIILYYDNRIDPNNPNDPDKPYIKVSVYDSPTGSDTDLPPDGNNVEHYTILDKNSVSEGTVLDYELKIVANSSTCFLYVTVNGVHPTVNPIAMHEKDDMWCKTEPDDPNNPEVDPTDDATRLYFKAGCYYPGFTGSGVTAKVAFHSLEVKHE